MNIAFMFDTRHPTMEGWYGRTVMRRILRAGVLQSASRHMRVSVGDVAFSEHTKGIEEIIYTPKSWDRRILDRLVPSYGKTIVYCWVFENMTEALGEQLHQTLIEMPAYLGAMDLDYSTLPHFACFKAIFPEIWRLHGNRCSLFYSMGTEDSQDQGSKEIFVEYGFETDFEDNGMRKTIFNSYPSPAYHLRIATFQEIFEGLDGWSKDQSSDLTLNLEELHPYLFTVLYAAAMAFDRATVLEELSQSYLSGRRFMEQLANFLFPPKDTPYIGKDGVSRAIKADDYKNRLCAYLQETLSKTEPFPQKSFEELGKEMADLYEAFHRGVHKPFQDEQTFSEEKQKCAHIYSRLGSWMSKLIEIDPASVRRPYLAYGAEFKKIMIEGMTSRLKRAKAEQGQEEKSYRTTRSNVRRKKSGAI